MANQLRSTRLGRPARPKPTSSGNGISPRLFYAVFATLFATNLLAGLALLMSPEIGELINGQVGATLSAYQDRIEELRLEVDRLHAHQYVQTGNINQQLQELEQQQEILAEQHQYVKALADKAAELGIAPIAGTDKPARPPASGAPLPAALSTSEADPEEIQQAGHQVRQMMDESRQALAAISAEATNSTDEILASLRQVGIKPDMPADPDRATNEAMGGPLLPPQEVADDGSLVDSANAVVAALTRLKDAREAVAEAPVHMPVAGPARVSSPFGNRIDPFTGREAFHPGMDFPWPAGTPVTAAGQGKVIFVGQINGYGNVVDIDHGGGIVTRYGHLSSFIATQGEIVKTGTPIGRVGSTGRSTGPHLHFEVRRNDQPVNPAYYLALGRRLAHFFNASTAADSSPDLTDEPTTAPGGGGDQDGDSAVLG